MNSYPTPVRALGKKTGSVSGTHVLRQLGPIPYESTLERDFLIRMDFLHPLEHVVPQPVYVPFEHANGKTYNYPPDYIVFFKADPTTGTAPQPLLVEIKPSEKIQKEWREHRPKWKAARQYARNKGWIFRVFHEARIRDHVFSNIKFLQRHDRTRPTKHVLDVSTSFLSRNGVVTAGELAKRISPDLPEAYRLAEVWRLLSHRELQCDLRTELTGATPVWR